MTTPSNALTLADKRIHIVTPPEFEDFAKRLGRTKNDLLDAIHQAIIRRHDDAHPVVGYPLRRPTWQLQIDVATFRYQILPDDIEVMGLESRLPEAPLSLDPEFFRDFSDTPTDDARNDMGSRYAPQPSRLLLLRLNR